MTVADALADRDRALDEVTAAHPYSTTAGLDVIQQWADRGQPFSLNDCRADLAAVGVTGQFKPGAVVRRALQLRIIRKIGEDLSSSRPTHGKAIGRYIAADKPTRPAVVAGEQVTVPVRRDGGGRFTTDTDEFGTEPLFTLDGTP